MMWLLLFSLIIHCKVVQPFPVFTFNGTSPTSTPTPSYAYLVNDVDLLNKFILCASMKQARFDDVGFYVISGKDSDEWLITQFTKFTNETWLTLWWDESRYWVGKLKNPMLDIWYHICLEFDLKLIAIEANVNGQLIGRVQGKDITNKPDKLRIKIGLGYTNKQFQGSVTNIKVLKELNTSKTLTKPCRQGQDDIISWSPENWTLVGSQWSLIEDFENQVCVPSNFYDLAISTKMAIYESMDICWHKLNNSIIPFEEDNNQLSRYVAWHTKITGGACSYIWTPLTKMETEGSFLNMNNNTKTTIQNWARGQPNGGKYEKFVLINVAQRALTDSEAEWSSCSSCRISNMLVLQLDGRCEQSVIGMKIWREYVTCLNFRPKVQDFERSVFNRIQWVEEYVYQVIFQDQTCDCRSFFSGTTRIRNFG